MLVLQQPNLTNAIESPLGTGTASTDRTNFLAWIAELVAEGKPGILRSDLILDTLTEITDSGLTIINRGGRILSNASDIHVLRFTQAHDTTLYDLEIVGAASVAGPRNNSQCLLRFLGCDRMRTFNLKVSGSFGSGVIHRGGTDSTHIAPRVDLTHSDGFGCYADTTYGECEDITVIGAHVSRSGDDAMSIAGPISGSFRPLNRRIQYLDFRVSESGSAGVRVAGGDDCQIGPGIIEGTGTQGVALQNIGSTYTGARNTSVRGVKVNRAGYSTFMPQVRDASDNRFGFFVSAGGSTEAECYDNKLIDCTATNGIDRGFVVRGAKNRVLTNCEARSNGGTANFDLQGPDGFQWTGLISQNANKAGFTLGGTSGTLTNGQIKNLLSIDSNVAADGSADNFAIDYMTDCEIDGIRSIETRATPLVHRPIELGSHCGGIISIRNRKEAGTTISGTSYGTAGVILEQPIPEVSAIPTATAYHQGQQVRDPDWEQTWTYNGTNWAADDFEGRERPSNVLFETIGNGRAGMNVIAVVSGTLHLTRFRLPKKQLASLRLKVGTAIPTTTANLWAVILDSAFAPLAWTRDPAAEAGGSGSYAGKSANTDLDLSFAGSSAGTTSVAWTPTAPDFAYLGVVWVGTGTSPTFLGVAPLGAAVDTPVKGGRSTTGLTTRASLVSSGTPSLTAGAATSGRMYAQGR